MIQKDIYNSIINDIIVSVTEEEEKTKTKVREDKNYSEITLLPNLENIRPR